MIVCLIVSYAKWGSLVNFKNVEPKITLSLTLITTKISEMNSSRQTCMKSAVTHAYRLISSNVLLRSSLIGVNNAN